MEKKTSAIEQLKLDMKNALEGRAKEFSRDYGKLGLWGNPFENYNVPLMANFRELFAGRNEEITEVSTYLSESLCGKGLDIAIIGAYGAGSQSLVNLFVYFLRSMNRDKPPFKGISERLHDIIDVSSDKFPDRDLIEKNIKRGLNEKKTTIIASKFGSNGTPVLQDKWMDEYRRIIELDMLSSDKVVFLNSWYATSWSYGYEELPLKQTYEKILVLKPFNVSETNDLINNRLEFFSLPRKSLDLFSQQTIRKIHEYGNGLPKFSLKIAHDLLDEALKQNVTSINEEILRKVLPEEYSYKSIKEQLIKAFGKPAAERPLKKTRNLREIFKVMIGLGTREVTATMINQHIKVTRPAISKNLARLRKLGLIEAGKVEGKDARTVPYNVLGFCRAVFESEYIIPEIRAQATG